MKSKLIKIYSTKKNIYRFVLSDHHIVIGIIASTISSFLRLLFHFKVDIFGFIFTVSVIAMYMMWLDARDNRRPNTLDNQGYKIP
jgi:hypothetical protein